MNTKSSTLKNQVRNGVLDMIVKGTIKAGDIISENQVIEKFQVSKSPVREALLELCKDDVLQSIPRCGYQIRQISPSTIHEITELRLCIELYNFRKIRDKYTKEQIETIFSEIEQIRQISKKNVWDSNKNNNKFHITLIELSGNRLMADYLNKTLEMYSRAYAQLYLAAPNLMAPKENHNHNKFLNSWKEGNYTVAEEYLRKDILMAEENFRSIL